METTSKQHALWIWAQANYPRRLIYYLILKGLVNNPKDLVTGRTNDPNLTINIVTLNPESFAFETSDTSDPFPAGNRHPLLRITNPATNRIQYIHESRSILDYFESILAGPIVNGGSPLLQAKNSDLISLVDEAIGHVVIYAKHSSRSAQRLFGIPDSARSEWCARDSWSNTEKTLIRMQTWAQWNGSLTTEHPWLAVPGTSEVGPGFPDLCLVAWTRYVEARHEVDVLEAEQLGPLRRLREAFEKMSWWAGLEDLDYGVAKTPRALRTGKDDFEV